MLFFAVKIKAGCSNNDVLPRTVVVLLIAVVVVGGGWW